MVSWCVQNEILELKHSPRLFKIELQENEGKPYERRAASLTKGGVFLMDAGSSFYQWNGPAASPALKQKAAQVMGPMLQTVRCLLLQVTPVVVSGLESNDKFWSYLGGKPATLREDASVCSFRRERERERGRERE